MEETHVLRTVALPLALELNGAYLDVRTMGYHYRAELLSR